MLLISVYLPERYQRELSISTIGQATNAWPDFLKHNDQIRHQIRTSLFGWGSPLHESQIVIPLHCAAKKPTRHPRKPA